jgi:hypothetical protein
MDVHEFKARTKTIAHGIIELIQALPSSRRVRLLELLIEAKIVRKTTLLNY